MKGYKNKLIDRSKEVGESLLMGNVVDNNIISTLLLLDGVESNYREGVNNSDNSDDDNIAGL
jgi:hypothetical protein